jgi:uncharacterized membrane protein
MKPATVVITQSGCFLPLLFLGNLFLGWIFLRPIYWLGLQLILTMLLVVLSHFARRQAAVHAGRKGERAIDVQGEVLKERE